MKLKQGKTKKLWIAVEVFGLATFAALFAYVVLVSMLLRTGDDGGSFAGYLSGSPAPLFSQKIFGPPSRPVLELTASCEQSGARIVIDWNDDENVTSFDIFRNGLVLFSGLTNSSYLDDNVDDETQYSYYVIANGPMGFEQSDLGSATTDPCGILSEEHEIEVSTFAGQTVTNHSAVYESTDQTPAFTGLTTIANALVDLEVHGGTTSLIATTANANGYWHWTPASDLALGGYVMYLTATNPAYFGQIATNVFGFEVVQEDEDDEDDEDEDEDEDDDDEDDEETSTEVPTGSTSTGVPGTEKQEAEETSKQFDFSLELKNQDWPVRSGADLALEIIVGEVDPAYQGSQATINVSIVDSLGNELAKDMRKIILADGLKTSLILAVPCTENDGRHLARAQISSGPVNIGKEISVQIENGTECQIQQPVSTALDTTLVKPKELIFISLVDWMGWLVVAMLIILLLLILLFIYLTRRCENGRRDQKLSAKNP